MITWICDALSVRVNSVMRHSITVIYVVMRQAYLMIAGFAPFLLLVSRSRNWLSDRMYHVPTNCCGRNAWNLEVQVKMRRIWYMARIPSWDNHLHR